MELLYADNIRNRIQISAEYYYFIINYIVGQKVNIHSNIGLYFHIIKDINKLKEIECLESFENFFLEHTLNISPQLLEILKLKDEYIQRNKNVKKLRSKRNLSKPERELLIATDKIFNHYKTTLFDKCKKYLTDLNLIEYLDLIDNDTMKINYTKRNRDLSLQDNEIGEIIFNNIINKEKLLVLGTNINENNGLTQPAVKKEGQAEKAVIFSMTVLPILTIPCSKELTKESLIILRNKFQLKFDILLSKIHEFRLKISKSDNEEEQQQYLDDFKELIEAEQDILQSEIDNHIYFQKIRNSDPDCLNVIMYMGIAPINFILTIYEADYTISKTKEMELEKRFENEIGENANEVFIFYEIETPINEQQSSNENN